MTSMWDEAATKVQLQRTQKSMEGFDANLGHALPASGKFVLVLGVFAPSTAAIAQSAARDLYRHWIDLDKIVADELGSDVNDPEKLMATQALVVEKALAGEYGAAAPEGTVCTISAGVRVFMST